MKKINPAYLGILVIVAVLGLLATTPVSSGIGSAFAYATVVLGPLTAAYAAAGTAFGSAVSYASVSVSGTSVQAPSWIDANTALGITQTVMSGAMLFLWVR